MTSGIRPASAKAAEEARRVTEQKAAEKREEERQDNALKVYRRRAGR